MRYRQIWDDIPQSKQLRRLTDAEERLFWNLWACQDITDDLGNFPWDSQEIICGVVPYRKGWSERKIDQCLRGLEAKGVISKYQVNGRAYGHFYGFEKRTIMGRHHHRAQRWPLPETNAPDAPDAPSEAISTPISTPESTPTPMAAPGVPITQRTISFLTKRFLDEGGLPPSAATVHKYIEGAVIEGAVAGDIEVAIVGKAKGKKIWDILDPLVKAHKQEAKDKPKWPI